MIDAYLLLIVGMLFFVGNKPAMYVLVFGGVHLLLTPIFSWLSVVDNVFGLPFAGQDLIVSVYVSLSVFFGIKCLGSLQGALHAGLFAFNGLLDIFLLIDINTGTNIVYEGWEGLTAVVTLAHLLIAYGMAYNHLTFAPRRNPISNGGKGYQK